MTGGNVYNRPRSALQKNLKRAGRIKKQQKKKQSGSKSERVKEDLPTSEIVRKITRSNPKANITLSGKKKRLLLKQFRREEKEKLTMDLDKPDIPEQKTESKQEKEKMDLS